MPGPLTRTVTVIVLVVVVVPLGRRVDVNTVIGAGVTVETLVTTNQLHPEKRIPKVVVVDVGRVETTVVEVVAKSVSVEVKLTVVVVKTVVVYIVAVGRRL